MRHPGNEIAIADELTEQDTELGSEVNLTPPDEVQSFHVQHLPHPHSSFSNSSMVTRSRCVDGVSVIHEMTVPHRVELI